MQPLKLDKLSMKSSIIPNIIHSLDASHLFNTLDRCFKNDVNIMTIHDCFGAHSNHIEMLRSNLKLAFIQMYISNDWLLQFHNHNLEAITRYGIINKESNIIITDLGQFKLPVLPESVDACLFQQDILNSEYMVS